LVRYSGPPELLVGGVAPNDVGQITMGRDSADSSTGVRLDDRHETEPPTLATVTARRGVPIPISPSTSPATALERPVCQPCGAYRFGAGLRSCDAVTWLIVER
jgi:hypothetical protein